MERIHKILAHAGIASTRKCEELIRQGKVSINGAIARIGQHADPSKDRITVNGKPITLEKKVYLLLHKPTGYVTTVSDHRGRKTVMDLISTPERIYPVGRLDKNTEGLLLFTNDGKLANKLLHPRYETEKEYYVELRKPLGKSIEHLKKGVSVDGRKVTVGIVRTKGNTITIRIHEGRKHIVRKLFKQLNNEVTRLIRTRMATLTLDNLKPGKTRPLTDTELRQLRRTLKI